MGRTKKRITATARSGVNYVRTIVESANCIFHEIHQENDYGNDAFIELVENENVRGVTLAVQIKSGKSFCSSVACKIPASQKHFEYWLDHSLPVIGIVYDPDEITAHWLNLKHLLKSNPKVVAKGPYTITFKKAEVNQFTREGFEDFFLPIFLKKPIRLEYDRAVRFAFDADFDLHSIGIQALMRQYRNDLKTWKVFVELLRTRPAIETDRYLIYFLAHVPGHPDIYWHKENVLDQRLRNRLKKIIRGFTIDDVVKLFDLMDEEGFERGSLGQSVEAIVSLVDDRMRILSNIARTMSIAPEVRDYAAILLAYYGQISAINELREIAKLDNDPARWAPQLVEQLKTEGYVYLY